VAHKGQLDRNVTESQIRAYLATTIGPTVPLVGRLLKRHA